MNVKSPLRILYLEDDPKDAELVQAMLEAEGVACHVTRVETQAAFLASLEQGDFDLILADYTLPSFDGISALKIAVEKRPEVPFIFVSGTLGEEVAIEALKIGATDYVFKTRLARILPSVQRALREGQERAERKRAEEALRASEHNFRLIVDSIPGLVNTTTAAGEIELANRQLLDYVGKTLEGLKDWRPLVHPDDRARAIALWSRSVETGHPYDDEHRLRRADGVYRWFHVRGHPLRDKEGHIVRWYILLSDIEERKKADEKVRRSEGYLAEAQKLSRTGSFGWNVCTGEIHWSPETFRIFEHEPTAKVTTELIMQRTHPEDRPAVQQLIERVSRERTDFDFEHRLLMPDGSVKYVRVIGSPSENEDGCFEFVGAVTDITESKRAEEALRLSESYLAEAQRLAHTGSWAWRVAGGDALHLSDEWYRVFGFDPAEGMPPLEKRRQRVHPEDRARWQGAIERAIQEKTEYDLEFRILLPDGTVKWIHSVGHPVLNASGELVQFVGSSTDITERKRAEEALRRSEGYLAEAQKLTRSGSWAWDVRARDVFWSQEMFRIFDYDPEKMKPTLSHFLERVHPEDRPSVEQRAQMESTQKERKGSEGDFRIVLSDGTIKHLHSIAHPVMNELGEVTEVVGTTMDVTERKRAEEKIRQSERELRQLLDLAPQHVTVLGPDGSRLYLNQAGLDYYGLTLEEWRTHDTRGFFHPDDLERMMSGAQIKLLGGSPHEVEARLLRRDGKYRWFLIRRNPLRDEQGRITRWYAAATDIEDRKQAEQQLQNENVALREEIDKASMFEEIVGESPALQTVLTRIAKVAPADSTVLITGETGTGKELIARAIHKRSRRSSRAFVSVNCAAIPAALIASELFGHEKGAFTGALQRRLGRFELADGGTIFLDEIGELPQETQIALLRVLQEREFERVGGNQSIHADVRVIAATNRDLQSAIAAGDFRSDLFYRLSVFPIEMPPLRGRKEDIPILVDYFIGRYSRKAGKKIRNIEKRTLELLQSYSWPGNIRELQNVVERSVVVCETETFSVDQSWLSLQSSAPQLEAREPTRMSATQEKEVIEAALAEAEGRVSGPSGAAAQLGVPPSTLESKIRTLKINKYRFKRA